MTHMELTPKELKKTTITENTPVNITLFVTTLLLLFKRAGNVVRPLVMFLLSFLLFYSCTPHENDLSELKSGFINPPDSSRPGVYWYFMDGNLSKEAMTKDLESMKQAGIGYLVYLEVNVGVPRGKVDFLSQEWKELFKHAVEECERLGIVITV